MVGGAEEEFTAAKELLSCMGANVVYCGQVGTGQVQATLLGLHIELLHFINVWWVCFIPGCQNLQQHASSYRNDRDLGDDELGNQVQMSH